jgi:hypothetical protein
MGLHEKKKASLSIVPLRSVFLCASALDSSWSCGSPTHPSRTVRPLNPGSNQASRSGGVVSSGIRVCRTWNPLASNFEWQRRRRAAGSSPGQTKHRGPSGRPDSDVPELTSILGTRRLTKYPCNADPNHARPSSPRAHLSSVPIVLEVLVARLGSPLWLWLVLHRTVVS